MVGKMKAILRTWPDKDRKNPVDKVVEINDDYDGDPYGNDTPIVVGSNQTIIAREWTSKGIQCSPDGANQRSDWFWGDEYAFHEWLRFPRFHKVMTHAFMGLPPPEDKVSYWLRGHAGTVEDMQAAIAGAGMDPDKFTYEEEPYGEGYFPMAHSFDDACEYFLKTKENKHD